MKWLFGAVAVLTLCIWGLPFREYDTGELLPVQTLQVMESGDGVLVVCEVGEGVGKSFRAAVADLRKNAAGTVIFDTAEQVVFVGAGDSVVEQVIEAEVLRPSAQVYFTKGLQDPEGLGDYLSAHESELTVAQLRAESGEGA